MSLPLAVGWSWPGSSWMAGFENRGLLLSDQYTVPEVTNCRSTMQLLSEIYILDRKFKMDRRINCSEKMQILGRFQLMRFFTIFHTTLSQPGAFLKKS